MDQFRVYVSMDRLHALARGVALPERAEGAALFVDLSGFTPLTEALARDLGPQRGAEEISRYLGLIFEALITELHAFGGSVISFSGDAMTCWLDADDGRRAVTAAFAMQRALGRFATITTPSGAAFPLGIKAAVVGGPVRRFAVGDPQRQLMDALAGATLDRLAAAEHQARRGEVVLDEATVFALGGWLTLAEWRADEATGERFAVVAPPQAPAPAAPWPPVAEDQLRAEDVQPWLIPVVYERLKSGQGEFLAELRPTVALFMRFTGLDYDLDDDAGMRLDAFIRGVQTILARYDGAALQLTIGDKGSSLYAAFGAPVAHEDDSARAVAAALELRALVAQLPFITSMHIGLAQGRTYAGAYGGAARRTYGVLGDSVNLAARLMQAAGPGEILAAARVRQTAGPAFEWDALPPLQVKGKAEAIPVFALTGQRSPAGQRQAEAQYALPMVGRQTELALILEKLKTAGAGQGQVVALTGEAGMGKSRLVAELIGQAREAGFWVHKGECQSFGTDMSYLVWREVLAGLLGLESAAPPAEQVRALEAQVAALNPALVQRVPLLSAVLSVAIPDNDLTAAFDAKLRKASLESLVLECVRGLTQTRPTLLVFEDFHWVDTLSQDLIDLVARAVQGLPVLVLVAYRPLQAGWQQAPRFTRLPHFTEVALQEFTLAEAEALIRLKLEKLFGPAEAAVRALSARLVARAGGNPFFIEEFINYLRDRHIALTDPSALAELELPVSLHSLILSRIDQLSDPQKVTLKLASIIGRLFDAAMLWGAYPQLADRGRVLADLHTLTQFELTVPDLQPEATYLFKHVLTQEVAYESLPFATRAALHDQIGQYLEQFYAETVDQHVELLAFHFDHSENTAKRRHYLLRAGEAAQADYANGSALRYYQRVLPLLEEAEQISVLRKLGQVLELTGQWKEAQARFEQALALAIQSGDRASQARCQIAIAEVFRKQGRYVEAQSWLDQAQDAFEAIGDLAGVGQALHFGGTLANQQGLHRAGRAMYERSLEIRRQLNDSANIANLLSNLGIVARAQGDYNLARMRNEDALSIRRGLGDRRAIANSLNNLGNVALDQGDPAFARQCLEEAVAIQRQVGDRWATANSLNNLANVVRDQGETAAARALYAESVNINRELGDKWALAYLLEDIGVLWADAGQAERALRLVGAAAVVRQEIGAPLSAAEQKKLDLRLAATRAAFSPDAIGSPLPLEDALDLALRD